MKVDRIKYGKSFRIGMQDIWERIDIEATVENRESINSCMDELKKEVEFTHRLLNPGLYIEKAEINSKKEKTEIAIDNCTTIEELNKIMNEAFHNGLVNEFINKKKQLSI